MHWLSFAVFLACFLNSIATCPYSSYTSIYGVLAADEYCKSSVVCAVNNVCAAYAMNDSSVTTYNSVAGVGNLKNYPQTELSIVDSIGTSLQTMNLPSSLTKLTFQNITSFDLASALTSSWKDVLALNIVNCPGSILSSINWPPNLLRLTVQASGLTDINYLPIKNYTYLQVYGNNLQTIINQDWRALTFLNVGGNPLKSFSNIQLSNSLQFFFIKYCKLSNITIDANTAAALNALSPWDASENNFRGFAVDSDILTDPISCSAIGGTIQTLFRDKTSYTVTACVLSTPSTTPPSTASLSSPTPGTNTTSATNSSTGVIIGVVVGVIAIVSIVIAVLLYIRHKKRGHASNQAPYYPVAEPQSALRSKSGHTGNFQDSGTHNTGPVQTTQGTGDGGRISVHLNEAIDLDVSHLRQHRLELNDLIITSTKPIASGAYGEVWLGMYGPQQVAVKRMKSREPRQVQKFIDEIILMSQLDCNYIVKFVGASWTRPIEIECVVEYMDLGDLRSYLVNQSPYQFTWDQKYQSILSIVRGLMYLHTYKPPIIHRDLKSRNVLLDSVKGTKLTDFGTSRVAEEDDIMTNGIGTYQWMAPEVIAGTNYSAPADIYSFGIILSEFCTHQVPYANMRHPQTGKLMAQHYLLGEVREGRLRPSFEGANVPLWVNDLAMQCLELNEQDRPTALELSAILSRVKV